MKSYTCIILILAAPFLVMAQPRQNMPSLQFKPVTFRVTDSEGEPVPGARMVSSKPGPGNAEGLTDAQGRLTLELAEGSSLFVEVTREGYYRTAGEIWQGGIYKNEQRKLVARELPDSFDIELKAVRDPVFMHRCRFRGEAPVTGQPVGFDLKVGDWISPHGDGVQADLYFQFDDIFVRDGEFAGTMTLTFPHGRDGIQPFQAARPFSREFGSDLAPPHEAPVEGYLPVLSYSMAHREGEPYQSYRKKGRNYLFRTRSVTDAEGRLLKACYGWIRGEIEFDPRGREGPQLTFESYFNPDPDPAARSLEYNLHRPGKP